MLNYRIGTGDHLPLYRVSYTPSHGFQTLRDEGNKSTWVLSELSILMNCMSRYEYPISGFGQYRYIPGALGC